MEQMKIYPYLVDEKRISGYYEVLLDDGFKLKIFDKKKDSEVYNYFLPLIRSYLFPTFEDVPNIDEFKKLKNDLKSSILSEHGMAVFEKGKTTVVCFRTGVCFVISDDKKMVGKVKKYEETIQMKSINLRDDISYETKETIPHTYAYILALYKMIYMNLLIRKIQNPAIFDEVRNDYVDFVQEVYNVEVSDKDKYQDKVNKEFNLDSLQLKLDNEFDLLYKNNKLNTNQSINKIAIGLCIVVIIIGIIILGNELYL